MIISLGRKVDKKIVVDKSLRACADILAAERLCLLAIFTVAEHCGPALSRRGAEIGYLHFFAVSVKKILQIFTKYIIMPIRANFK
jgi:hypothetical protein